MGKYAVKEKPQVPPFSMTADGKLEDAELVRKLSPEEISEMTKGNAPKVVTDIVNKVIAEALDVSVFRGKNGHEFVAATSGHAVPGLIITIICLLGWVWEKSERGSFHFLQKALAHLQQVAPDAMEELMGGDWEPLYKVVAAEAAKQAEESGQPTLTDLVKGGKDFNIFGDDGDDEPTIH